MYHFNQDFKLVVSATFTADLLRDSFSFWKTKLGIPMEVEFTTLNSIFEELANPEGTMRSNPYCNVILIRFDDWCRTDSMFEEIEGSENVISDKIHKLIEELVTSLKNAIQSDHNTYLIGTCSSSEHFDGIDMSALEQDLLSALKEISGVYTFSGEQVLDCYAADNYYDAYTDQIGHVPYKQTYYDVYGTYLIRKLLAIYSKPYKVIVADCDNTLWSGVVGEDGVLGVRITEARKQLQQFLVDKSKEGFLICLNSKNNPEDVDQMFATRDDMILKTDQIVTSRINWNRKSDNLISIAKELNLGLDSFVFLDDSPQECMEVKAGCPDVATFCLPENEEEIPTFLKHLWILDKLDTTEDDKNRTKMYQDNVKREAYKEQQSSLLTFIEGLNMDVKIETLTDEHKDRAYQLMWRVNQFNLSGKKMDREEFQAFIADQDTEFATVHASDRFGDYGMVGLLFGRKVQNQFVLENLMMSCRVIGKGVEYQMLSYVGRYAESLGLDQVKINIAVTEKNAIAMKFADTVFNQTENVLIPAMQLAKVDFKDYLNQTQEADKAAESDVSGTNITESDENITANTTANTTDSKTIPSDHEVAASEEKSDANASYDQIMTEIALTLNHTDEIHRQIIKYRTDQLSERTQYAAPENEIQEQITAIWEEVLEVSPIGIHDSIFEVGGDSIQAIQILSRVRSQFETDIPLTVLFEDDLTIEHLAQATEDSILNSFDEDVLSQELSQIENMSEEEIAELLKGEMI